MTFSYKINRPVLRYPGGKFLAAKVILNLFPTHECYVEPFGGGASLLLQKSPSPVEVYNDIDDEVVNFFRVLRDREEEFIRAIALTPYARKEQKLSYEKSEDELESARRLYVRLWQGYGNTLAKDTGWRYVYQKGHLVTKDWSNIQHLYAIANRLKQVQIDCDTAENVLLRYDSSETFFFVDPPYPHETRKEKRFYNYEMTDDQHEKMAETLLSLKGKVILCSYESALYDRLFGEWEKVTYQGRSNGGGKRTEVLWLSPNCHQQQLSLFDLL